MKTKHYIIGAHIGFWVLNFLYGIFFWGEESSIGRLFFIPAFYINYFILVPYFFRKGNFLSYALWFLIIWTAMTVTHVLYYYGCYYLQNNLEKLEHSKLTWIGGYVCFYFIALSTGSRLIVDWTHNKKIAHTLLLHKTNMQIQSIRTNVNIPFILETLASMEVQALESPKSVQQPVIALSNFLRYSLYDTQSESALLQKEIEVIRDYFFLINQNQSSYVLTLVVGGEPDGVFVPTNILVKFISAWKEFRKPSLSGNTEVTLHSDKQVLKLSLPLENSSYAFVTMVKEKFALPAQNGFTIECEGFFRSIQLIIRKIKDEN